MRERMMYELGWSDAHPVFSAPVVIVSSVVLAALVVVTAGVWLVLSVTGAYRDGP